MGQQQQISPEVKAAVLALLPALVERFQPTRVLAAQLRVHPSRVSRLINHPEEYGIGYALALRICELSGVTPESVGLPASASLRLRDAEGWQEAAKALAADFTTDVLEAAGDTVPPEPVPTVTSAIVDAYAHAWRVTRRELAASKLPGIPADLQAAADADEATRRSTGRRAPKVK